MGETSRQGIRGQQGTIFELQLLDKDVQDALVQDICLEVRINCHGSINNVGYMVHMSLTVTQLEKSESGCSPRTCLTSTSGD